MKKAFYLLLLITYFGFSQETYEYKALDLLIGKKIKISEDNKYVRKDGYYHFYKKPDLKYNSGIKAKFDNYFNSEFTVISITDKGGILKNKILELKNEKFGTIYYDYQSDLGKNAWIFSMVNELFIPDDYWCKLLENTSDKFTGKTMIRTTSSEYLSLWKDNDGIYLYLKAPGSTLNIGKKDVIILLADGSKIENSNHLIEASVDKYSGYNYSVLIKLNQSDIEKLKKSYITDYRLFIYDFQPHEPLFIQKEFNCILKN